MIALCRRREIRCRKRRRAPDFEPRTEEKHFTSSDPISVSCPPLFSIYLLLEDARQT